jgi:tRNA threonylcarbamoyladenosine biosynthesis protein TsaE
MEVISKSVSETLNMGRKIAKSLKRGDIICLFGELGSGKTLLTKGIAEGLGIKTEEVISPSFVLIRQHVKGKLPLYHFDLYRLKDPKDILALGYEEYLFDDAVAVIEWADRLKCFLPKEFLKVELSFKTDSKRRIKFVAFGARFKELLKEIHENIRH